MTLPYEWLPIPHTIDVCCPECGSHARFEFPTQVPIAGKGSLEYFEESKVFEVVLVKNSVGQSMPYAQYYPGLHGHSLSALKDLPDGYNLSDWEQPDQLTDNRQDQTGTLLCSHCSLRRKHELNWPSDAFYQVPYKGSILWAFNRDIAEEILAFIESKDRNFKKFNYRIYLMRIPSLFLSAKARDTIVRKLSARLAEA